MWINILMLLAVLALAWCFFRFIPANLRGRA